MFFCNIYIITPIALAFVFSKIYNRCKDRVKVKTKVLTWPAKGQRSYNPPFRQTEIQAHTEQNNMKRNTLAIHS